MATLSPSIRAQDDPISSLDLPPIRPGAATGQNGFSFPAKSPLPRKSVWMGFARHTLGIAFLLIAVFLFTASNFLASVSLMIVEFIIFATKHGLDYICRQFIFETVSRHLLERFFILCVITHCWSSATLQKS